jgi:lantibiotic biosynthesis protein
MPYEIDDLTLCHGAGGAADVLLCGAVALGGPWHKRAQLAYDLGHSTLERYGRDGGDWPCGLAGHAPPGLFRGLAGIGWWFLRLHDRTVPSPLTMPSG